MLIRSAASRLFISFIVITLASCGGGGGGGGGTTPPAVPTISGTAAAGSPIIGTVTIKDSAGMTRSTTIAADGNYSFDVTGLTPPFMLRAEGTVGGRHYVFHSAATDADINGNVNVTPFTELIVANIALQVAENYYDSGAFSSLTPAELDAAEAVLQQRIEGVLTALGVEASIDLLRSSFATDHTGLDAALDILRVTVDPAMNTAEIVNVLTLQSITDQLDDANDNSALSGGATGITEWEAIRARYDSLAVQFATGLPAQDDPNLLAQFDTTGGFLDDGEDLATFLGDFATDPEHVGMTFPYLSLISFTPASDGVNGQALVAMTVEIVGYGQFSFDMYLTGFYNNGNGTTNWVLAGNQRILALDLEARSILGFNQSNPNEIQSGLDFDINVPVSVDIDYAVVTGPGLPTSGAGADGSSAGILLARHIFWDDMWVAPSPYSGYLTDSANVHPRATNNWTMYTLTDGEINSMPVSVLTYTVNLYDDNGTPGNLADDTEVASYDLNLPAAPLPASTLSNSNFPVLTGPSNSTFQTITSSGGTLTLTWTLPAGLEAESAEVLRFYSGTFDGGGIDIEPGDTSTSYQFTAPPGTVSGGLMSVVAAEPDTNRNYSYRRWIFF